MAARHSGFGGGKPRRGGGGNRFGGRDFRQDRGGGGGYGGGGYGGGGYGGGGCKPLPLPQLFHQNVTSNNAERPRARGYQQSAMPELH